jgi:hypothetical protein
MTPPTQTRELCQRALDSPCGIEVEFENARYEFGADEARQEAQTLIKRIRAFRMKAKGFDTLDCVLDKRPGSFAVKIIPHGHSVPVSGTVRDLATGSILSEFSQRAADLNSITFHLLRNLDSTTPPLTPEQESFLFQTSPIEAAQIYAAAGWPIPTERNANDDQTS